MPRHLSRLRARPARVLGLLAFVAVLLAAGVSSQAASSNIIVTMSVPSATTLDATGCPYGTPSRSFGTVLPGTSAVTAAPCSVLFGSSNDTSTLRLLQTDGVGTAMYRMSDGTRDTGFGALGIQNFSLTAGTDAAYDANVQRDGKVVVVGTANGDAFVLRRLATGGNDPSFNGGSPRYFDFGTANDIWMAVDIDWDGSIVLGGHSASGASQNGFVTKLTSSGADDPAFGGIKTINVAGDSDTVEAVVVDSRSRIVAAGAATIAGTTQMQVSRYRTDGSLDPTFNTTGRRSIAYGGYSFALDVAVRANDGLALAGTTPGTGLDFALVVLDSTGADDPTFNGTAIGRQALSRAANDDIVQGVAVQPDGKFILGGSSIAGANERVGVVRINATGVVDSSFGGGAQRLAYVAGNEYAEGVYIQPDGGVLLAGAANGYADTGVMRLTSTGTWDNTFDTDGRLVINGGGTDGVGRPTIGPDGRIFLAGVANSNVYVQALLGTQYPNYAGAWTGSRFAACLETLSAGTNAWPVAGSNNCQIATPANWKGVAAQSGDADAIVAQTASGTANAAFRFGLQVDAAQSPGTYSAPLSFEVVAPM